jgi:hypothetical protein
MVSQIKQKTENLSNFDLLSGQILFPGFFWKIYSTKTKDFLISTNKSVTKT